MVEHWLIIGASGGIGRAFVDQLLAQGKQVSAISRQPLTEKVANLAWYTLPQADAPETASVLTTIFSQPVTAIVLCQGWLHGDSMQPEKTIRQLSALAMQQSFQVNIMSPALYLQALFPFIQKLPHIKLAVLSAKVGSITDNQLGGWYSYRMSKAALNMLVKTTSIELARYNKTASLVSLHPGTTDTALSAPFQRNLPEGQLQSAHATAERLLPVIAGLNPEQSGQLLNWDGQALPY
ncbi:MAG: SDR family NAD(P)-dependent oxidoreductase [Alishewanella sp.]|nr:SDR family NAD(P)-dependent oxidoreductase [Alishewanella sp.]